MTKVQGIGGVFFRSGDPASLREWYSTHLGLPLAAEGHAIFPWRHADDPAREGKTVWATFPKDTKYFGPTSPEFMVNYIVDDLDAMLASLREAGVEVDDRIEDYGFGRFGWATDPEGNRLEFWEPKK
jgi:predicted enzyme related to lactoylglutathione lyase